jgi:MFS transporter, DHA1 family, multidrug resistance protein
MPEPAATPDSPSRPSLTPVPLPATAPVLSTTHRAGLLTTLILSSLTALAPLSMDMYLPSLPAVTRSLHSTTSEVQLTLTACLVGMALGQLVVGPLSDALGRRRPLLTGLVVYVVATAACAVAPSTDVLIACRLLQGLAGAAGIVIARAVVRDLYSGLAVARFFSTLMLISGVAPIVAPLLGGQILRLTTWRGVFVVLIPIGLAITAAVALWLKETLPPPMRRPGGLGHTLRAARELVRDVPFTGYVLAAGFAFAALFAYLSASPFVVQDVYGASPQTFSLMFGVNSVGLVSMGQLNGRVLVGRVPLERVLATGLAMVLAASTLLVLMVSGVFGHVGLVPVAAALFLIVASMGITLPNTTALALARVPRNAGTASALLGTLQFLVGALATPLVGLGGQGTAVPMGVVILATAVVATVLFLALCRPWRQTPIAPTGRSAPGAEESGTGRG